MKVVAAMSIWDLCMERGHHDLEQFEKVHRYISDQLFTRFVSDFGLLFKAWLPSQGPLTGHLTQKSLPQRQRQEASELKATLLRNFQRSVGPRHCVDLEFVRALCRE